MTKPATRRAVTRANLLAVCPNPAAFKEAGINVQKYLEIERRWPTMTTPEKQQVITRIYPHIAMTLEDLLK